MEEATLPRTSRRRWLLGALVLCALLGVGLLLSGWFPQERLRLLAERQIRQAIGPGSRIGALHVVPGRLYAEIADFVLEGPTYTIEAPRARVRASWALVMGRGIDLHLLEAEGAHITLRPSPPDQPASAVPAVRIADLRLKDATLVYSDPALEGDLRLEHLDVTGSIGSGVLVARAAGGAWQRTPQVPFGPLNARARVSSDLVVDLESADAGTLRSRLRASGRIQTAAPGALDLKYGASLDLAELAGYAPEPIEVTGALTADGSVGGTLEAPTATGTIEGARIATRVVIRQNSLDDSFQKMAGHHLARVVTGRESNAVSRSSVQPARAKQLDFAAAVAPAERLHGKVSSHTDPFNNRPEILLLVGHAHREKDLGSVTRECIREGRSLDVLHPQPGPVKTSVPADRGPAHADRIPDREIERQRPISRVPHAEAPVEPLPPRFAHIGVQKNAVAFDPFHDDVSTWKSCINPDFNRTRCRTPNRAHDQAQNHPQ
jgi:hypothetical protein